MLNIKNTLSKLLSFLDNNILTILTGILILVVPLYPKLPLADLIEGYIVRMRLEDILIFLTNLIYIVQLIRKKVTFPKTIVAKLILAYILIGFLSSLSAIFITRTVPFAEAHIFKLGLHLMRRIEYFSLFFIAYSSIKNKKDLKIFVITALLTLVAVLIYGIGQKYFYWPAFSTMNREFSKGMRLYLTPTSRVMSTFGGHYDYAAYLMMALTALVPAMWLVKNNFFKLLLATISLVAYWSLILTASRTSFGGYVLGLLAISLILSQVKGFWWALKRYSFVMVISLVMMLTIGDLSTRFLQIVQSPSAIHQLIPWVETGKIEEYMFKTKDFFLNLEAMKRHLTEPSATPPPNSISTDELSKVAVPSDIPPSTAKPLPPDVTRKEDEIRVTQVATSSATGSATTKSGGDYSENALKYGLSVAIRLDALWPRAISSFKQNPLLGTGYSTLVKTENTEFTQAESTDNDYLRMLGETGILGTIAFLSILLYLCYIIVVKYRETTNTIDQIILLGLFGSIIGLLISATYIDVFESSKVAYSLWLLAALAIRTIELNTATVRRVKKS